MTLFGPSFIVIFFRGVSSLLFTRLYWHDGIFSFVSKMILVLLLSVGYVWKIYLIILEFRFGFRSLTLPLIGSVQHYCDYRVTRMILPSFSFALIWIYLWFQCSMEILFMVLPHLLLPFLFLNATVTVVFWCKSSHLKILTNGSE